HRSSISDPKGGASQSDAALCRRRVSSSSPVASRPRRSGNSRRPARTGSASPGYGVRCRRAAKTSRLLTTEPGPDVAPIHDRQMVILERSDWSAWLELIGNEAELLLALPVGSLKVEQVR